MTVFWRKDRTKHLLSLDGDNRMYCCAFTGHRPEKLDGKEGAVIVALRKEILKAVEDGYRVFLTGMSRGVDIWAADIVIELRRHNKDIKLFCAIPFEGMENQWSEDWRKHYQMVLKQADCIEILSKQYGKDVYRNRNVWLCEHSTRLIAVFDGSPSGTGSTIRYAQEQNIPICLIAV